MKVYIDVDDLREALKSMLENKKLSNPKSDIGHCFNGGIALAIISVDTYLLQLKSSGYGFKETTADD